MPWRAGRFARELPPLTVEASGVWHVCGMGVTSWSLRAAPPPIGLTGADPFAGGEVSRADSRVR
jgi:hypothetical protein